MKPSVKPGFIYVATDQRGQVKVGRSKNPTKRCSEIGGAVLHFELFCNGNARHAEKLAQGMLIKAGKHVCGEVFNCTIEEAKRAIKKAVDNVNSGNYEEDDVRLNTLGATNFGRKPLVACRLERQVEADLRELARREHRSLASYMEHVLSVHTAEAVPPRTKTRQRASRREKETQNA